MLSNDNTIKALDNTQVYKYLRMIQNSTIKTTVETVSLGRGKVLVCATEEDHENEP